MLDDSIDIFVNLKRLAPEVMRRCPKTNIRLEWGEMEGTATGPTPTLKYEVLVNGRVVAASKGHVPIAAIPKALAQALRNALSDEERDQIEECLVEMESLSL
jgi:hypothetical protein